MGKLILATLTLVSATPALSANWVRMFQDKKASYYYDSTEVGKTPSGYRRVWEMVIPVDRSKDLQEKALIYINCNDSSASVKTMFTAHSDGTTTQDTLPLNFEPIVPETLYDDFRKKGLSLASKNWSYL